MRSGGLLLVALLAGAVIAAAGAGTYKGSDRPPSSLTDDAKAIWMTEWVPCWREKMSTISKHLHIPIRPGVTPQQAAKKLAHRAVFLLYETAPELQAAADGCLNGILWRYYHPDA
jgi:hypothetical protein